MAESSRGADLSTVSVVVVNFNAAAELDACLRALRSCDPAPKEVILVDNGSSDRSPEVAAGHAAEFDRLKVVSLSQNKGLNVARNAGIEAASGDVVAFVDNDATVAPDWIPAALDTMRELDSDALQCKLLLRHDPTLVDSVGYLVGPFGFPRHIARPGTRDGSAFDHPRYVFGAKGAGMMFRRSLLEAIGGFDPSYFLYGDETEIFWRIFRAGGTVAYAPRSIIFHAAGGTQRILSDIAEDLLYREGTRNYIRLIAKNQHPRRVALDVFGQAAVWTVVALVQLFRRKVRSSRLILRGVLQGLREIPMIAKARRRDPLPFRRIPRSLRARLTLTYMRQISRAL